VKKQAQKRITPTEALHILMDGGLTAHGAAARLDQAVKTNECRLWHHPADEATPDYFDEPVPPDYAAQCLTIVAHVVGGWSLAGPSQGCPFQAVDVDFRVRRRCSQSALIASEIARTATNARTP